MRFRPRLPIAVASLFFLVFAANVLAQSLQWAVTPVGPNNRPVRAGSAAPQSRQHLAAVDAGGNLFIAGHSYVAGGFPEAYGQFLAKYAAAGGAEQWRFTSPSPSTLQAVAVNAAGDAFVVGYTVSNTIEHQYVARISGATGTVMWEARAVPLESAENWGVDIVLDAAGDPIVLGGHANRAVVTKYDANSGAVQWSVVPGADVTGFQSPFGIEADRDGNVVGFTFFGDGSGANPSGSLLFKVNGATGARMWATPLTYRTTEIQGLALDGAGKPTLVGKNVAKFSNVDGTLNWQRTLSNDGGPSMAYAAVTAGNGDVYVTGTQGAQSQTVTTARLRSLDGATLWSATLPGTDPSHANQIGRSLALDANGNVLVAAQVFYPDSTDYELQTLRYRSDGVLLMQPRFAPGPGANRAEADLVLAFPNAAYTLGHYFRQSDGADVTVALKYVSATSTSTADLELTVNTTASAFRGKDFVLTFSLKNNGPDTAGNAAVTVPLPAGPALIWSSPGCGVSGSTVVCTVPSLANGAATSSMVVLRPTSTATFSVTASASADSADPFTPNNAASVTATVGTPPAANIVPRYRLYNPISQEHLFTTDENEYNVLGAGGVWVQEGISGRVLDNPGSFNGVAATPYYRLYCSANQWHHWTTDPNEYYTLAMYPCWGAEGVDGYILPTATTGATQLYRLVYGDGRGLHHWTTDANEYATLTSQYGWVGEGGAGFVIE